MQTTERETSQLDLASNLRKVTSSHRPMNHSAQAIVQRITHLTNCCLLPAKRKLENVSLDDTAVIEGFADDASSTQDSRRNDENHPTCSQNSNLRVDQSKMMTGIVVNGFHPQLSTWKMNQMQANKISRTSSRLDKKICDAVNNCRTDQYEQVKGRLHDNSVRRITRDASINDIYSDLFENSNVPQVIATPGGRFGAWNKEFLNVCGFAPTGPYASLTIFDLVIPSALPQLHQIFMTALYEEFPTEGRESDNGDNDNVNPNYLSLTVPCIDFAQSELSYFITLSLMYDSNPTKRCFHCILSTDPAVDKIGAITHIEQDELMKKI